MADVDRARSEPEAPAAWLRGARFGLCWLLLLAQLLIPSSYYLWRSEPEDERFAWRMFSALRFRTCKLQLLEQQDGRERTVALSALLHASWIGALRRGRERVIERFLATRCTQSGMDWSTLVRSCREVDGTTLPVQRYRYACEARRLTHEPAGGRP